MMRKFVWAMTGMLAAMAGLACDDKNDVPPEMLRPRPAAATPQGPTTRDMVDGPKKSLRLGVFPLTLEVPKTWNLQSKSNADLMTVEGPAVGGDIVIQLVPQTQVLGATGPERMLAEAKADMAAKPHRINRAELRDLGPAKVLEVRMISNPYVNGQPPPEVWGEIQLGDSKGSPVATTRAVMNPLLVRWSFTVFVPRGEKKYSVQTMGFMGLGFHEFEQNEEFLEQMMKTLKYEE